MKEWKNIVIMVTTEIVLVLGALVLWFAYVPLAIVGIFMVCVILLSILLGTYLESKEKKKRRDKKDTDTYGTS
jgi:hypothetical protein